MKHRMAGLAASMCLTLVVASWARSAQIDGAAPPAADVDAAAPVGILGIPGTPLKVIVTAIEGPIVQVRTAEDQPWQKATVGMELGEGAEFRTGPRSAVQLSIPPDQVITLDRLGTIKVLQAIQEAGTNKVTTDLGMKYGRARYQIEAAGLEHDSKLRTPSSTLAVRGSDVTSNHDAFVSYAMGQGHLQFINRRQRRTIEFGQKVRSKVTTDRPNAGSVARAAATVDAKGRFAGRTPVEAMRIEQAPEVGGDDLRQLQTLQANAPMEFAVGSFTQPLPNTLAILLAFSGTTGLTDVNLSVIDPNGFTLTALAPISPDGKGIHNGNTIVDGSGSASESVTFGGLVSFTPGQYTIIANLVSADAPGAQIPLGLLVLQAKNGGPLVPIAPDAPLAPLSLSNPGSTSADTTVTVPK